MIDHTIELTKGIRKLIQNKEMPIKTPPIVLNMVEELERKRCEKEKEYAAEYERQNREYEVKRSKGIPVKIPILKKQEPIDIVWRSIKLAKDTVEKCGEYREILLE